MLRFIALWLLVHVFGRISTGVLYAAADAMGTLAWYTSVQLRRITRNHMRHVLVHVGDPHNHEAVDRAARGCVRSAARYYADFARSPHLTPERAFAGVQMFDGINHLFEAYDRGCGVILVSAHLGSPEFIFRSAGFLGLEMLVLTEPLSPPMVHDFVHRVRRAPGVRFLPADRPGLRETVVQLRAGGIVAVLSDRDIQGSGDAVSFFGERATLPTGAVELALRTKSAVVPTFVTRTDVGRYRIEFQPPVALQHSGNHEADLSAGLQALAQALEQGISATPEQWFVLHPVWPGLTLQRDNARRTGNDDNGK